jgi:hypothetical protein
MSALRTHRTAPPYVQTPGTYSSHQFFLFLPVFLSMILVGFLFK